MVPRNSLEVGGQDAGPPDGEGDGFAYDHVNGVGPYGQGWRTAGAACAAPAPRASNVPTTTNNEANLLMSFSFVVLHWCFYDDPIRREVSRTWGKPPTSDRTMSRHADRTNIPFTVARALGRVWVLTTSRGSR